MSAGVLHSRLIMSPALSNNVFTATRRRNIWSCMSTAPLSQSFDSVSRQYRREVASSAAGRVPEPTSSPSQPPPYFRQDVKPFSHFLTDTFHRPHNYLRISITERCSLRCLYCMPEEGVPLSPSKDLLTTPEIIALARLFISQGVSKIRLTGGEPTVRRDILSLMQQLGALRSTVRGPGIQGLKEICITTNGISLHRKLDAMVESGLTGVNLSLDTLDPWQYQIMTRRDGFSAVCKSINRIQEINRHAKSTGSPSIKFKINCVVIRGRNDREIPAFVEMTRDQDIEVRFIEYMPFDGNQWARGKMVSYAEMTSLIQEHYPAFTRFTGDHPNETSKTWHVPGFAGRVGFITSMTHNFCGTCNRLRITSDGNLKVCLFGNAEVSLRDILRKANAGEPIEAGDPGKNGAAVWGGKQGLLTELQEQELLEVIGMAVKRKKAKHAGMGTLEHMKNRPMISIGG